MRHSQLFSRRTEATVDFRPDPVTSSPFAQLRRLSSYLATDTAQPDDITDCPQALNALREFVYRKTFTGCTHEQFLETDANHPDAIDWLLAVAEIDTAAYKSKTTPPRR